MNTMGKDHFMLQSAYSYHGVSIPVELQETTEYYFDIGICYNS